MCFDLIILIKEAIITSVYTRYDLHWIYVFKDSYAKVSCREYYCYKIQIKDSDKSILLQFGRLLQQYIVDIAEKGKCYHCGQNGHWLRNCPKYLAEKKADKETQGKYDLLVVETCLVEYENCT